MVHFADKGKEVAVDEAMEYTSEDSISSFEGDGFFPESWGWLLDELGTSKDVQEGWDQYFHTSTTSTVELEGTQIFKTETEVTLEQGSENIVGGSCQVNDKQVMEFYQPPMWRQIYTLV